MKPCCHISRIRPTGAGGPSASPAPAGRTLAGAGPSWYTGGKDRVGKVQDAQTPLRLDPFRPSAVTDSGASRLRGPSALAICDRPGKGGGEAPLPGRND